MDGIYGDLENYNEVNAVEELRNENSDLKFKLEEYAAAMDKLQKDYDKLSSEFKKLEINYSSLLKTARAEIERKTQMISNLNLEKDMMVLNSIQNNNKHILDIRRNRSNSYKRPCKDVPEVKKPEPEHERERIEERICSVETSSTNTEDSKKLANLELKPSKLEYIEKHSDSKENIMKPKPRPQSLRSRRKSMPMTSKFSKFSSDEEFEALYSAEEQKLRSEKARRHFESQTQKVSETSGIDEKYSSYHESSRETYYKSKLPRHNDKYKVRDKYEPSQRYRKHFSPERTHRRGGREIHDENYQRLEFPRHRFLKSPSAERSYDSQRRNRDRRTNYEKDSRHDDRYKYGHDKSERQPAKHKISHDYDEPNIKRVRTDSWNMNIVGENKTRKEEDRMFSRLDHLQHTSCQSPDYMDAINTLPVKEIMETAASHLEDPRLTSKKYISKNEGKITILSTLVGRNVEIIPIDKSLWNIEKVTLPEALQKPPNQIDNIADIYSNIDNPVTDLSLEDGELQSETHETPLDPVTDSLLLSEVYVKPQTEIQNAQVMQSVLPIDKGLVTYSNSEVKLSDKEIPPRKEKSVNPLDIIYQEMESFTDIKKPREFEICKPSIQTDTDKRSVHDAPEFTTKKQTRYLTSREMVEGDLELSDETSDLMDFKNIISENVKTQSNKSFVYEDRSHAKEAMSRSKESINQKKTDKISNKTPNKKIGSDNMSDRSVSRKQSNAKKKLQKTKGASKGDLKVDPKQTEKKTKPNIEIETKPKEVKNKFCDLFGDSSSLITPEDLGVGGLNVVEKSKYDHIFEDAQDAIDVNVEIMQTRSKARGAESTKENENTGDRSETPILRSAKAIPEKNNSNESPKKESVSTETLPIKYGNLNIGSLTKETGVVQTVIISTGIQARCDTDNNNGKVGIHGDVVIRLQDFPSALATSTPHKVNTANAMDGKLDPSNNTESIMTLQEGNSINQSVSCSSDANNAIEPDVRIFVRRRRKVKRN